MAADINQYLIIQLDIKKSFQGDETYLEKNQRLQPMSDVNTEMMSWPFPSHFH